MCGRYSIGPDITQLAEQLKAKVYEGFTPRYNAAPSQALPVVTNKNRHQVVAFNWGIIPFWAKDQPSPKHLINARAETVSEKATFKRSFEHQRCVVLADGYYEWKKTEDGKIPHRIVLKNRQPFVFAGLWSTRPGEEHHHNHTIGDFCIITTAAPASIAHIHDRMPVILKQQYRDFWLSDTEDTEGLRRVLEPYKETAAAADDLKAFPVAKSINNVQNDEPGLLEELNSK